MGLFSVLPQKRIDIYDEIAYELRSAAESDELRRVICKRAEEFLPQYESDLMYALFTEFDDQVRTEKDILNRKFSDLELDIIHHGYKGKSGEEYERKRKEAVEDILNEKDSIAAVKKFYEAATPLQEAAKGAAYNELLNSTAITVNYVEVCARLLTNGKLSLTEIVDCLSGVKMYDLYGLAERLKIPVTVTDEEKERIAVELEKKKKRQFTCLADVADYFNDMEGK